MALSKEQLSEIKSYMDARSEAWRQDSKDSARLAAKDYLEGVEEKIRLQSKEGARRLIVEEKSANEKATADRLKTWSAVAGVSIIGLLGIAWNAATTHSTTIARESALNEVQRILDEDERVVTNLEKFIGAVTDAQVATQTAKTEAERLLKEAQEIEKALSEALTSANSLIMEADKQLNGLEGAQNRVSRASQEVSSTLAEARQTRINLEALSEDITAAQKIAEELSGAQGIDQIVEATLNSPGLREQIVAAAAFPTGAVIPFTDQDELAPVCPTGWSIFRQAIGRFILGADETKYPAGEMDGEEMVTLATAQMPPHSHEMTGFYHRNAQGSSTQRVNLDSNNNAGWRTSTEGGGQPHNNMPPYIALYFCKKN